MNHPPRNRVKKDPEEAMIRDIYQGVGYNTKKGFINIEVRGDTVEADEQ